MNAKDLKPADYFAKCYGVKALAYGKAGSGKCLAKGTEIIMFDGSLKKVEDVKIGDQLMGVDSQPRKVISLDSGMDFMYEIVPVKGESYIVNSNHVLSLRWSGHEDQLVNLTVQEYLDSNQAFKKEAKGWRVGVNFKRKKVPIDPYILGVWLGDGSSDELAFHTIDPEIVESLNKFAYDNWHELKKYAPENKCPRYRLSSASWKGKGKHWASPLKDKFRKLNLFNNKHVPKIYKINDCYTRLEILAGLLDTDGHLLNNGFEFTSKLKILAEDVVYLCKSLGLAAYIRPKKAECTNNGRVGDYFSVSISGNTHIIPTRIARKKATPRKQKKNVLRTGITVVSKGVGSYYGFELEGSDKLFLLKDFTVTHNTPSLQTAPRPLLLACEPGLGSLRGVQHVATYDAMTIERVEEFLKWFHSGSAELKNFDTLIIDSLSQLMDLILTRAQSKYPHGKQAYGNLDEVGFDIVQKLYYTREKHLFMICQYGQMEEDGQMVSRPMFPGQALNRKIPHLFDQILYFHQQQPPGWQYPIRAVRCRPTLQIMARDRFGRLDEIEWADTESNLINLSKLFYKVMS